MPDGCRSNVAVPASSPPESQVTTRSASTTRGWPEAGCTSAMVARKRGCVATNILCGHDGGSKPAGSSEISRRPLVFQAIPCWLIWVGAQTIAVGRFHIQRDDIGRLDRFALRSG